MSHDVNEFELRLKGYRMATAEVLYRMPDHPDILQTFIWQTLDIAPRFPRVHDFLLYWVDNIEGLLHSVRIASKALITPQEWRMVDGEFRLH